MENFCRKVVKIRRKPLCEGNSVAKVRRYTPCRKMTKLRRKYCRSRISGFVMDILSQKFLEFLFSLASFYVKKTVFFIS